MKNSVACCYLTYNHPETIEDVLGNICESYGKRGIDIYIYDSSNDDKTKHIVEKYRGLNLCNLHYVDVKFISTGDEKLLYVIQGKGLSKHYDYIWPTKDRCYYNEAALDEICEAIDGDYDVVFSTSEGDRWELRCPKVKDVYDDPVEFFAHYAQLSTNWEAMIRRTKTMVDPIDWELFTSRYNMNSNNNFNQLVSIFARLAELDNPKVRVIHESGNSKVYSKFSKSGWRNETIKIWIETWIPAIDSLPTIYDDYKLSIIKSQLNLPALFGSSDNFLNMIKDGILTREVYLSLVPIWPIVSDVPKEHVELLLEGKRTELADAVIDNFMNAFSKKDYDLAYNIFIQNMWLELSLEKELYNDLEMCFAIYRKSINEKGRCVLFEGVDSVHALLDKYRRATGKA